MKDFLCTICNKKHPIFTTIEFGVPNDILKKMLSGEFECEKSERWSIINKDIFLIKGIFNIPLKGKNKDEYNSILAWIEVSKEEFLSYIQALKTRKKEAYQGKGILFSEINYFSENTRSKVIFTFKGINQFPKVDFINKSSTLCQAHTDGLLLEEMKNFMVNVFHGKS